MAGAVAEVLQSAGVAVVDDRRWRECVIRPLLRECEAALSCRKTIGERKKAKTRTGNAPLYASRLLLATDWGLEKRVEDGVDACCKSRCVSGTRMGKCAASDEWNAAMECCSFF